MADDFLDELNRCPVTYGLLLTMGTLAFLTDSLGLSMGSSLLEDYGSCVGVLVMSGEPWRLLSYSLLHGNLIHIGFCGYMILSLGPRLEKAMGSLRYLVMWVVSALGGGVAGCLVYPAFVPLVGSSGAVFGMLGAALALNIRGGRTLLDFTQDRGSRQLIYLVVVNLILGWIIPFISNTGHIGGLVAGLCCTLFFLAPDRRARPDATARVLQVAMLLLFVSYTWLAIRPVHTRDWLFREYLLSPAPERRAALGAVVRSQRLPFDFEFKPGQELEPRTGIPVYSFLETLPGYARAVANWKAQSPWLDR